MLLCVLILVVFVTSPAVTRVTNNGDSSCSSTSYGDLDAFKCDGGRTCVELNQICDGIRHCLDGRDELFCSSPSEGIDLAETSEVLHRRKRQAAKCSKYSQWQCRDGSCISVDGKCDGAVDCADGSDETFPLCRKMPCQRNLFRCTYGACVDGNAPCNGSPECADKSDELLPKCRNETTEVRGKFRCQDGSWIEASDHCDGIPNCPDGSDETVAACADKSCPGYLFQCAYGACVDRGSGCNGKQECADGSDESDELCNRQGSGTTATPPKPGKCVVPPYPEHGTFVVSNVPNARPGQSFDSFVLEVRCNQDYGIAELYGKGGDGSQQVFCIDGSIIQQMPKCTRFCKLNSDPSVRYTCQVPGTNAFNDCENYVPPDMAVQPVCNNNYYYNGVLKRMRCVAGVGSFDSVALCKPGLTKNGTNITILFKDKVEIYISGLPYTSETERDMSINLNNSKHEDVSVNVGNGSNVTVNINNNVGGTFVVNINNSVVNIGQETTHNPLDYEISEEDWRMAPESKKRSSLKSNTNKNSGKYSERIIFRDNY